MRTTTNDKRRREGRKKKKEEEEEKEEDKLWFKCAVGKNPSPVSLQVSISNDKLILFSWCCTLRIILHHVGIFSKYFASILGI